MTPLPHVPDAAPVPPPGYPAELEGEVTTRDGSRLHVRPIRPEDAPGLADFHHHLSRRSIYRRFLFLHPDLSPGEIERFTCVDYVDRLALVVEDEGSLVAVGRYDRRPGTAEAEVAFVVADRYQHHGIGALLLDLLADAARQRGIAAFVADTLVDNTEMLDVFLHSGFDVDTASGLEVVGLRFSIEPDATYQAARAARRARDGGGGAPPG